jgi:hypothetical protein
MTDEELTAVHDRVMELIRQRKWVQAAQLADTVSQLSNFHPWDPYVKHWGLCEKLADYERKRDPARAVRLYKMALETMRLIASSTGGKDGLHYRPSIEQLEKKIQRLENPQDKSWWHFWGA